MTTTKIDARLLGILATATNRDSAGRHFVERYSSEDLAILESAGLISIDRPMYDATGTSYHESYHRLEITEDGQAYVDDYYDGGDYEADGSTPLV